MKKFLLYSAGSLLLIATIGFSLLTVYDTRTRNLREEKDQLETLFRDISQKMEKANGEHERARTARNHLETLVGLKVGRDLLQNRQNEMIGQLQQAILAAYLITAPPGKPTDEAQKQWNKLTT